MRTIQLLIPALSAALLVACSTPASRIEDQKSVYSSYPPEVQQTIAAGKVAVGFTPEQALIALGTPRRKYSRKTEGETEEIWSYSEKRGPAFGFGIGGGSFGSGVGGGVSVSTFGSDADEKLRVVFVNGKVSAVEESVK